MRFNGLKSHLRLQKLRFLDAPGLFLLEIVLTGAYDLADVLANVLVLKWMIGALMGRDLIRAAWVLGGFLVYQLSVSFLWHWYFERVYPQWKERLEYKLNRRLYRIMLDADCRKYNDEGYFHGYRRALQFTQTKMEETLEFYRQLFGRESCSRAHTTHCWKMQMGCIIRCGMRRRRIIWFKVVENGVAN